MIILNIFKLNVKWKSTLDLILAFELVAFGTKLNYGNLESERKES